MKFIKEESILNYTESLQESIENKLIDTRFPHISKELVDLLREFLIFNPEKRPSPKECLKNCVFDSMRIKALEEDASF